ncbi:response regulator [Niabella ginsengisoli]|uniref:Response regulator n=1 Tax=Niabella ginsengisoli TaxID=522298 RepID=A0ABS9SIL1_9BACT|nr:response regulator [Niabella ginsengisoli]MCH5598197.1 response regulator [Niabella ginsengisoli]
MNNENIGIAIFDDDEDILSICNYVLQDHGWRVSTFSNCENVAAKIKACQPGVIFMDNWIPPKGGIVATQELKSEESLKDIPVVYFSANSEISKLANNAGAEYFLAKPFDLDELVQTIQKALENSSRAVPTTIQKL